jgi:hypothetical protein
MWRNEVLWDIWHVNYMNADHHRAATRRISLPMDDIGVGKNGFSLASFGPAMLRIFSGLGAVIRHRA